MPLQFSVPQFVDVENKIIGPISVRQFIIIAVAIALIFVFFKFADFGLFLFASIVTAAIAILFAFVKINGRPFHYFLLNFLMSVKNPHLRVWKKEVVIRASAQATKKSAKEDKKGDELTSLNYIKIAREKEKARSRLTDLSLLVDTGGYYEKK